MDVDLMKFLSVNEYVARQTKGAKDKHDAEDPDEALELLDKYEDYQAERRDFLAFSDDTDESALAANMQS